MCGGGVIGSTHQYVCRMLWAASSFFLAVFFSSLVGCFPHLLHIGFSRLVYQTVDKYTCMTHNAQVLHFSGLSNALATSPALNDSFNKKRGFVVGGTRMGALVWFGSHKQSTCIWFPMPHASDVNFCGILTSCFMYSTSSTENAPGRRQLHRLQSREPSTNKHRSHQQPDVMTCQSE